MCYICKRIGHNVDIYHKLKAYNDEKRDLVGTEIAKLHEIKFENGVCCKLCAMPQETCYESVVLESRGKDKCLYKGIMREAIAAIMVISPDIVMEKMYA